MNPILKSRTLIPFFLFLLVASCDLFLNEQELDNNISCERDFFVVVDQPPVLIGGIASLQEHIKYPSGALDTGIEGRVVVQFLVTEIGDTVCHEVVRSMGKAFDIAAINAVKEARFEPGYQNQEAVIVQYALPITFRESD